MQEPPSLAGAIRFSVLGLIDSLHAFLAWNFVLVIAAVAALYLLVASNLALLVMPFLAPLACGLARLATVASREGHVTLRTALPGIRHRFWAKVGLAAAQCLILLLAVLNLLVSPAIGGLFAALSMATSVYLGGAVVAYGIVGWTLLCDPSRESLPLANLARLALVIVLRHPLAAFFLLVVAGLATVVAYNLVVPSLLLPAMVLLLTARYVLPAADELTAAQA